MEREKRGGGVGGARGREKEREKEKRREETVKVLRWHLLPVRVFVPAVFKNGRLTHTMLWPPSLC